MATVHDVAAAIIKQLGSMTAMKLEKLVYYCQGWHLARHKSSIFDEPIEAWRQGPVVPVLYRHHRRQYTVSDWPLGDVSQLSPEELGTVQWVTTEYGGFGAIELSRMTHRELPWKAARGTLSDSAASTVRLSAELMMSFYARQLAEPESAVTSAVANAALEGAQFSAEWQDRLRDVAFGLVSADDLVAAEIARIKSG